MGKVKLRQKATFNLTTYESQLSPPPALRAAGGLWPPLGGRSCAPSGRARAPPLREGDGGGPFLRKVQVRQAQPDLGYRDGHA